MTKTGFCQGTLLARIPCKCFTIILTAAVYSIRVRELVKAAVCGNTHYLLGIFHVSKRIKSRKEKILKLIYTKL